jgi:hypothetical protein
LDMWMQLTPCWWNGAFVMKIMNLDNIIDEIDNMDCHMDENWLN